MPNSKTRSKILKIGITALFTVLSLIYIPKDLIQNTHAAASIVWDGGGDGITWSDANNWDLDRIPTTTDDVLIDSSTTVLLTGETQITSLELGNSGGSTTPTLEFTYTAVTSGTPLNITGDLTVNTGSVITHTATSGEINLLVGGNTTVNGSINADHRGHPGQQGPGAGTSAAGASHGGHGGDDQNSDGSMIIYGSITEPTAYGSGGGNSSSHSGRTGGGMIKLLVSGTLTVDGPISAKGREMDSSTFTVPGGGSGGSIWISADTVEGSSTISTDGGYVAASTHGHGAFGGGGAGGRIAIYYTTKTLSNNNISSSGGYAYGTSQERPQRGGAGTIYLKQASQTDGDLIIKNSDDGWVYNYQITKHALTPISEDLTFDNVTLSTYANIDLTSTLDITSNLEVSNKAWFTTQNTSELTKGSLIHSTEAIIIDNGATVNWGDASNNLTIAEDTIIYLNTPQTFNNIVVNGTLAHSQNSTTEAYKLNITATGDFTVNATGAVNVDHKGYAGEQGPGAGSGAAGASHAGHGGHGGSDGPTTVYGSITEPTTIGSGGGNSSSHSGRTGGGAVKLNISGTLTVNGPISAKGREMSSSTFTVPGGGAGGSIWISANTIQGSSTISADGGYVASSTAGHGGFGGGGAGGRIALYYTTKTLSNDNISATGGYAYGSKSKPQRGGAGTIYLKQASQTDGDLIIRNTNDSWYLTTPTKYALTPISENASFDNLTISSCVNVSLTSTVDITTTLEVSDNSWLTAESGSHIDKGTLDFTTNSYIIENGSTTNWADGNNDLTIAENTIMYINVPKTFNNVVVNGTLGHSANTTAELYKLDITTTGDFTINATGKIDTNYFGYSAQQGPGAGTSGAGASHAAHGGHSSSKIGSTTIYGSITEPATIGSGGGSTSDASGTKGGGAIKLTVAGTLTANGPISANGQDRSSRIFRMPGGGAGGSIWLSANTIQGSSTISANGGYIEASTAGHGAFGGGGAGGRIALYYTTKTLSNDNISSTGGTAYGTHSGVQKGGAGTIYLKQNSDTEGELIIDNKNTDFNITTSSKTAYTPIEEELSLKNLYIKNYAKVNITSAITVVEGIEITNIRHFENSADTINRTGHTFDGWNTTENGSGTAYTEAEFNSLADILPTAYAQWTPLSFTITFNINNSDSGSAPTSITQTGGTDVDLPTKGDLTKPDYSFQGWNTESDGTGDLYDEEETISMPLENTTLYATWLQTYIYESNGAGTVKITDYHGKNDTEVVLPTALGGDTVTELDTNSFWQSDIETLTVPSTILVIGQNAFYGSQISSLTLHNDITEIGQDAFRSNDITTVTLPTNLQTLGQGAFNDNELTSITIPENITVIPDFAFAYNSLTTIDLNEALEEIGANAFANNQLTNVSLTDNILSIGDDAFRYNAGLTSITLPLVTGYTTNWTDSGAGSYNGGDNITDFTLAYTGTKEINTYTISFNSNGATGGTTPYTISGDYNELITISSNSLTKTGYSLTGWNTVANGSGTAYTTRQSFNIPAENLTLYAQWEINEYTLSFDGQGNNLPSDITEEYNSSVTISSTSPTRGGYTFAGWNTSGNGSGTTYNSGDSLSLTEDTTLYAQWNLIPVVIEEEEEIEEEVIEEEIVEEKEEEETEEQQIVIEEIQINGEFQDHEEDHILIDEETEEIEIEIPVEQIIGDLDHEEIDEVVIEIDEKEYVMTLSEDKKTYVASIRVPEVKGDYTINITAEKDGEEISSQSINLVVEDKKNPMMFIYILIGTIVVIGGLAIIIRRKN